MFQEKKIISVHIEKTGGTSLESVLIRSFGKEMVLLWLPNKNVFTRTGEVESLRTHGLYEHFRFLLQNTPVVPIMHKFKKFLLDQNFHQVITPDQLSQTKFSVLHGHFISNQFNEIIPNGYKTVVLRDPLERMVSHFKYWTRTHGSSTHRVDLKYNPEFTFEDFSFFPILQNYQSQAIAGEDLKRDFSLVGTANKLDIFVDRLLTDFQIPHNALEVPVVKRSPAMDIDEDICCFVNDVSFCKRFEVFHSEDYHNYNKASEML